MKFQLPENLLTTACKHRRFLHQHPELSLQEFKTTKYLKDELTVLGFKVKTFKNMTGLVATWPGADSSRAVALRADIDALPVQEKSNSQWTSQNPGTMHACGHDGHTAILLGVAGYLSETAKKLPWDVDLVFQPAEESGEGAKGVLAEGAVSPKRTLGIFGLHNWPSLAEGKVFACPGAIMGSVDNFKLEVFGKGGHGAQPHLNRDPVIATAHLVSMSQTLISREMNPFEPAVLTVTSLAGGNTYNVVPDQCELKGTIRTLNNLLRSGLKQRWEKLAQSVVDGMEMEYRLTWVESCPVTDNDPQMALVVSRAAEEALGKQGLTKNHPSLAGEDFAYYLQKVPGAFFWIGAGSNGPGLHNPGYEFNDRILETGITMFLSILEQMASGESQNHLTV